jgi:dTDP-4-dehydrorhamnose reductase
MRAVVTGASGLLGAALLRVFEYAEGWSHTVPALPGGARLTPLDLRVPGVAEAALAAARPDVVVHCAALTDVDACERDPAAAWSLNAEVPGRLAAAARAADARFIQISTDAVYDGERPGAHAEDEPVAPVNAYARSKLDGERAVLAVHPEALVARTTMHGWSAVGRLSFSESILRGLSRGDRLTLFSDVSFSALPVSDLARLLLELAEREAVGVLNVGAADAVTKEAFGRMVAREFGLSDAPIEGVTLASRGLTAPRPRNTALDVSRLAALLGRRPPTVAEGLRHLRETLSRAARAELRDLVQNPSQL